MPRDFRESLMSSVTAIQEPKLQNYVNGAWRPSTTAEYVEVINPATAEVLTRTPLSTDADVDSAVQTAAEAFPVAPHASRRTDPISLQAKESARGAPRRTGQADHPRKRENICRGQSGVASRHRECGSGLRHSDDDAG